MRKTFFKKLQYKGEHNTVKLMWLEDYRIDQEIERLIHQTFLALNKNREST